MMKRKNECMKNSLKQLFRKKWMSILFFGIIMLSTVFFTLGCSLWMGVQDSINRMKDTFSTIGTVTQKPDSLIMKKTWDAALQKYKLIESSNSNYKVIHCIMVERLNIWKVKKQYLKIRPL